MTKRVLVVDDSPTMQEIIKAALEDEPIDVDVADHGVAALKVIEEAAPDLILTDLNMIHMDGFEFVGRVRALAECEFTPIIFLTTESSDEMKRIGRDLGAAGWIQKPFNPKELVRIVRSVLR